MGKAGRIACIFVPMALTVVSLILLAIVGLGQTNKDSYYLSNMYLLRANLTDAGPDGALFNNPVNNQTDSADQNNGEIVIYNSYSIGLWNYCAGGGIVTNSTHLNTSDPASTVAFCTGRETQFVFKPQLVWGLSETFTTRFFSSDLSSALNGYENGIAKALGPLYIVTLAAAATSVLVGLGAIFSRLGSVITTLVALAATGFSFAFAVLATIAYFGLEGAFNTALKKDGISFEHGAEAFGLIWLAVGCLLIGSLFWAFSSCCVSGRSSRRDRSGAAEPLAAGAWNSGGYQRMDHSPGPTAFHQQQSVPLTPYGGPNGAPYGGSNDAPYAQHAPYEPYRHA